MPDTFAVIESMATLYIHDKNNHRLTARVWREENELCDSYDNGDLFRCLLEDLGCISPATIVKALAAMPRVAAVEVKDEDGQGVVVYTSWP